VLSDHPADIVFGELYRLRARDELLGEFDMYEACGPGFPEPTEYRRQMLNVTLADGTIDAIATDHAPHAPHEKVIEFERAMFGITGFETALGLAITRLHLSAKIPLTRIVELFTAGPARVLDLRARGTLTRGCHADVTIFDCKKRWTFDAAKSRSRSHNTPFDGWSLTGRVAATIVAGRIVYRTE